MGIDDRDYMRERYARRRGLNWNDKLGRVEQGDPDTVLPIPANGPARLARRPRPPAQFANDPESPINSTVQSIALLILIAGLALVLIWWAISAWFKNKYRTFPPSGSVTVSSILSPRTATSKLRIKTGRRQAIVQLLTPETGNHVISIFMQPNQSRDVPVPPGTWRLRVIKGEEQRLRMICEDVDELVENTAPRQNTLRPIPGFEVGIERLGRFGQGRFGGVKKMKKENKRVVILLIELIPDRVNFGGKLGQRCAFAVARSRL